MKRKLLYFIFYPFILLALAGIFMLIWNEIAPDTFHLIKINYWQALGLLVLARILFGRFHFPKPDRGGDEDRKQLLKEKLMTMSDEDKASFKEEWRKRCGDWQKPSE